MKRPLRILAGSAIFLFFVWAGGRAADQEFARAEGGLSERGNTGKAHRLAAVAPIQRGDEYQPSSSAPRSESLYQGRPIRWWARRAVQARRDANARGRTIKRLRASLRHRWQDESLEAIAYASTAYSVSYTTLRRKAHCETGGTFDPYAKNRSSTASGLFQFLTSTWASTPYASYSIWDPYANALAAAWMHDVGRGREWSCR